MITLQDALAFTLFACWGSFLNVVAYRLLRSEDIIFQRSSCTHCHKQLAWFDMLPVISWIVLQGTCRMCRKPISILYPFIELVTAVVFFALWKQLRTPELIAYAPFISAMIVSVRTDLESMLISSYASLGILPLACIASFVGWLPITLFQSISGTIIGYLLLYLPARAYYALTQKEGMGEGDFELLACIGAYTGPLGAWTSVLIASTVGSFLGILWIVITKRHITATRIPFGPFLALGAIVYVLFSDVIHPLLGL